MLHLTVLGSGSSGNCAFVESAKTRLLVDGGLSAKQIALRLQQCGVNPLEIDGILLTHEHSDHISGLDVWSKQYATPIYCNRSTEHVLRQTLPERPRNWRIFATGSEIQIGDINVQSFSIPHDAVEPVGFVLRDSESGLGFLTDLGHPTKLVYERVRAVQTLLIETNHDEKLLQNDTKRPWSVKQRILSRHGHLSNAAAGNVLAELLSGGALRRAVLGHLSRDCNTPELALEAVREKLASVGGEIELHCAGPRDVSPRMAVA